MAILPKMLSGKAKPAEEYEMVSQLESDPAGSGSGPFGDTQIPFTDSVPSFTESATTPSPRNSSSSSRRSELFDEIFEHSKSGDRLDDFNDNPIFQRVLQKYTNSGAVSKKAWGLLGAVSLVLWIIGVIVYSNGSALHIVSSLSYQTSVELSGHNVTLSEYRPSFNNVTIQNQRKGLYSAYKEEVLWLNKAQYPSPNPGGGGYYLGRTAHAGYQISQINSEYSNILFESTQFVYKNNFFYITNVILNPAEPADKSHDDMYHIVVSDKIAQWRHSSFALYWLFNKNRKTFTPIEPPKSSTDDNPLHSEYIDKLHFAEFSPNGDYIIFGFNHNLYLQDLKTNDIKEITTSGAPEIFNGKSDWVYEEEVILTDKLFWWSPDQENLVFASLNDTKVQDYELDFYIKDRTEIGTQYSESTQEKVDDVNQYPIKTSIKYPKPGTANPLVTLYNYKLSDHTVSEIIDNDKSLGKDFILYSCSWVDNSHFLMKQSDRYSTILSKKVFIPTDNKVTTISSLNSLKEFGGWIEKVSKVTVIPGEKTVKYVDRVVTNNRTHLALFESATSKVYESLLTESAEWDIVADAPVVYDKLENMIYALTTMKSSMDSHLVAIDLSNQNELKQITGTHKDGVYSVDFSPDGQYLSLFYGGPLQPWQRLINMGEVHDEFKSALDPSSEPTLSGVDGYIERNKMVNHFEVTKFHLKSTNFPTKLYKQISIGKFPDGSPININVIEILPPNFDPSHGKKYPILVHAYGGPGSQTVDKSFAVDFQEVASATLDAIVLIIDPRGTGGQGWKFRAFAQGKIGYWEPRDITTIVSEYISVNKKFINKEMTAIWGWSYGGFTTLKTLEFDSGNTFKFGVAVAPVTNWLFYDSVYTERYMGSIKKNENYEKYARINDYKSFSNTKRFLIMHGTSDDNVHLQNSLWLLDKFNLNNVENYDVHFFPDSDHSIYYHNANSIVYDKLLHWLKDAFKGKFEGYSAFE